jgi:hypothetical protein
LIGNATYGLGADHSYDGLVTHSFAWGSGDSAFHIAHCLECSTLVDDVTVRSRERPSPLWPTT